MNIESFFQHHGITTNPFAAEEARLDPVFGRLIDQGPTHPEFPKIMGDLSKPSTSIVFGEKGSGKTAIRLLIGKHLEEYNTAHPDARVLAVAYDDLNPVLDNLLRHRKQDAEAVLDHLRVEDHQDAILSLAVTQIVNGLLGETGEDAAAMPADLDHRLKKKMRRRDRVDLALLAAIYDRPTSGAVDSRFDGMWRKLRLGWGTGRAAMYYGAIATTIVAAGLGIVFALMADHPWWLAPALGLSVAVAALLWGWWGWRHLTRWWLCRKIAKETPAVDRTVGELRQVIVRMSGKDLARQPLPVPQKKGKNERDSRYQLTRRLMEVIQPLGYEGMIVLLDRIDEPTLVAGDAERMQAILWPMFDNKFLKQERIGLKMLLPIELRHQLHRESPKFFQTARLDKQNMVDRLSWSGATLYDLCNNRLRACSSPPDGDAQLALTDLFEADVTPDLLIDALDQMHQPRDAFKFLYAVIQEHCRITPEDHAKPRIARLTLESIRRDQAQRVQEFYRGLTPA